MLIMAAREIRLPYYIAGGFEGIAALEAATSGLQSAGVSNIESAIEYLHRKQNGGGGSWWYKHIQRAGADSAAGKGLFNMFTRKQTCGVCGYRATPTKEEIYIAEEPRAFVDALTKPPLQFSAMDCPRCGCQIALAVRFPRVDLPKNTERDDADESEVAEGED